MTEPLTPAELAVFKATSPGIARTPADLAIKAGVPVAEVRRVLRRLERWAMVVRRSRNDITTWLMK